LRIKLAVLPICFFVFFCYLFCIDAQALEQKTEDLSASVEVAPVFSLSLDNPNLAFGLIGPDTIKVLGEGRYFNEVRCRSNSGRPWSLKAHLVSLSVLEKDYALSRSNMKWNVAEHTGSAQPLGKSNFQPFSQDPVLIYTSLGDDNRGKEVILRFQYSLSVPADAPAGEYIGQVIFTMVENP